MLITVLPEGRQEVRGWGDKAPLPKNGFNDDGCGVLRGGLHLEHPLEGVVRTPAALPSLKFIKRRYAGRHLLHRTKAFFDKKHCGTRSASSQTAAAAAAAGLAANAV